MVLVQLYKYLTSLKYIDISPKASTSMLSIYLQSTCPLLGACLSLCGCWLLFMSNVDYQEIRISLFYWILYQMEFFKGTESIGQMDTHIQVGLECLTGCGPSSPAMSVSERRGQGAGSCSGSVGIWKKWVLMPARSEASWWEAKTSVDTATRRCGLPTSSNPIKISEVCPAAWAVPASVRLTTQDWSTLSLWSSSLLPEHRNDLTHRQDWLWSWGTRAT